jgi:hypothetical protein
MATSRTLNIPLKIEYLRKPCCGGLILMKAENDERKCNLLHDRYDIFVLLSGELEITYRKKNYINKVER